MHLYPTDHKLNRKHSLCFLMNYEEDIETPELLQLFSEQPPADLHGSQTLPPRKKTRFERHSTEQLEIAQTLSSCYDMTPVASSRWTEHEEIILLGVATDCNLLYCSQAPWEVIFGCYQKAIRRFNKLYGTTFLERTCCAVKKHWRAMYSKVKQKALGTGYWYRLYHNRWLSPKFNKNHALVEYSGIVLDCDE